MRPLLALASSVVVSLLLACQQLPADRGAQAAVGGAGSQEVPDCAAGAEGCAEAPAFAPTASAASAASVADVPVGDAPTRGDSRAPVTIVVFSDFECPFCARAVPTINALQDRYGDKVRVAFKQQPLPFHAKARLAAAASLAAHEQGKFWEMHDRLFASRGQLDREDLERYAQELGLDLTRFNAALDSMRFEAAIDADVALAQRLGVMGTPTFFVNGRKLVGAQPLEKFTPLIDEALAAAR